MDGNKQKDGLSVKEMEAFARKHRLEVFFCLAFILACFFTFVMWGAAWSIVAATVGGIIGVFAGEKIGALSTGIYNFVFKHEQTTQIVLAVVGLVLAIFIPPLYFLLIGLHGGKDMHDKAIAIYSQRNR